MKPNTILNFDSVTAFHAYIDNRPRQSMWPDYAHSSDDKGAGGCKGITTASFEEAENLLIHGDKETYERIKKVAASHVRPQYRAQRQTYSSVVGCAPNVAAFVAGAPNSMIAQRLIRVKKKVVNILFNNCWAWNDNGEQIIEASLSVMEKVLALEATGVRVNLYTAMLVNDKRRNKGKNHGYFIKIKDATQAPDILKMTYPMTNDSMLRRQGFRFMETTEGIPYVPGYLYCVFNESTVKEEAERVGIRGAVILTGHDMLHMDDRGRAAYIDARLEA